MLLRLKEAHHQPRWLYSQNQLLSFLSKRPDPTRVRFYHVLSLISKDRTSKFESNGIFWYVLLRFVKPQAIVIDHPASMWYERLVRPSPWETIDGGRWWFTSDLGITMAFITSCQLYAHFSFWTSRHTSNLHPCIIWIKKNPNLACSHAICVPRANGPPPRDVTLHVVPYTLDSATPRTEDDQDIDQSGQIETHDLIWNVDVHLIILLYLSLQYLIVCLSRSEYQVISHVEATGVLSFATEAKKTKVVVAHH